MRKIFKKIVPVLLGICLMAGTPTSVVYAITEPPQIMGSTACVIDLATGTIIYDKEKDVRRPPASTTKIMTAILALEKLPLDSQIVIDDEVIVTGGNTLSFKDGEIISVRDLLYGLLLYSANDAAVALAKAVSGATSDFVNLMNERAKELGALNTTFKNPHGLTEEGHLSTAYDIAVLARKAMENKTFREIVSTDSYTIQGNFLSEERKIFNTNLLVYDDETMITVNGQERPAKYDGAIGIKTGFTLAAGNCLVAAAEKNGTTFISVVLNSGELERFSDSILLMDWGYLNYRSMLAVDQGELAGKVKVVKGEIIKADLEAAESCYLLLPNDAADSVVTRKIIIDGDLEAPVTKGTNAGRIEVYEGDRKVREIDLVVAEDIEIGSFLTNIGIPDKIGIPIIIGGLVIIGLFILSLIGLLMARLVVSSKKKKRRKELAMEMAERRMREEEDKKNRNWRF